MDSPGVISLGDFTLTAAGTQVGISVDGLEGMLAACLQARLAYGSGGTTARLYFQTSLNQGTTWVDIACVLFGTASETEIVNLSALTPKSSQVTPTDGALADDTVVDGVLGDQLRAKLVTTGVYAGSTVLEVRANVR
jgi:hypothetical protein